MEWPYARLTSTDAAPGEVLWHFSCPVRTGSSRLPGPGVPSRPAAPDGPFPAHREGSDGEYDTDRSRLRFGRMTRFVIDAPTLLHLVAERVPVAPAHQLVAPQLLRSQALALLFDAVRRGELTEEEALDRHDEMTRVKVRLLGDRVSRRVAWQIAREHGLDSTAEAEYLAVTRLQADVFVSVDPDARQRADGIVPVGTVDQLAQSAGP